LPSYGQLAPLSRSTQATRLLSRWTGQRTALNEIQEA
jgi:hypothetical protein